MNAPFNAPSGVGRPPPPPPLGLLAELTHRCPLRCTYCSNPLQLEPRSRELDTRTWVRLFSEAAALGVIHLHLSGGEPTARSDIVALTRAASAAGLYTNLITSGIAVSEAMLDALLGAGLDHVQLSMQGADAATTRAVAGSGTAFAAKEAFAAAVVARGFPLTLNAVIHRMNIGQVPQMVEKALTLGAKRLEIAHAQYYGWALKNRAQLMPERENVERTIAEIEAARARLKGRLVIDAVFPDYYARYPKLCNGGWGQRVISVTPAGLALPCHAAQTIEGLDFPSVREHSLADIWTRSPAFAAYRGTDWMLEPCRSCERREIDFGGCRCQALALTGNARNADPACVRSSHHGRIAELAASEAAAAVDPQALVYRSLKAGVSPAGEGR